MKTRTIISVGFGVIIAALIANAFFSYRALQTLSDNNQRIIISEDILKELELTLSYVKDAETGSRGYIITGQESYLEPYYIARDQLKIHLEKVKKLVTDRPLQASKIPALEKLLLDRNRILSDINFKRTVSGFDKARDEILQGEGKAKMDEIRAAVAEIISLEEIHLQFLENQGIQSHSNIRLTFAIVSLTAFVLVGSVYALLHLDIKRRQRTAMALQEAKDLLEERVEQRTQELQTLNKSLRDEITERTKAEEKLEQFTRELERSNRELQDFAFVASHDLQEPLRKIQAFGDRLRTKYGEALKDDGKDYLERMQNAARRMHILINDLLTYSRVASKAQPFAKVNLDDVARDVVIDLEVRMQQTGGWVQLDALPTLEAEPVQMRQLLQNLIGNALKFRQPEVPPTVKVSSRLLPEDEVNLPDSNATQAYELQIADNGIGFDEKYLDRIFTPFQRLHSRSDYEGTGMGLAVCRKIVERHRGTITAHSAAGQGTTFIVTLPATQNEGAIENE